MIRKRLTAMVVMGALVSGSVALTVASPAAAAPAAGHWGSFSVSGTSREYTGTMTLTGFPTTTFTSTSRQAQVISGASTWQSAGTPPGGLFGTSRNQTYLNQRPNADRPDAPASTTYTFAEPTPGGTWSFVLGDIDADQVTVAATDANGNPVPVNGLGFQGVYNSCGSVVTGGWACGRGTADDPTPGSDVPQWDADTATLVGNKDADDTAGATASFQPTTPLRTLTMTYQQRSGLPVYQTWFADRTATLSGSTTIDGAPYPGAVVTATAPRGVVYTTVADADGNYSFENLPALAADYRIDVQRPTGATGSGTTVGRIDDGDATAQTVPFASPAGSTSILGTVTNTAGTPIAGIEVQVDPGTGGAPVTTTTNAGGNYVISGVPAASQIAVTVGGETTTVTSGAAGQPPQLQDPITAPVDAIATISGAVLVNDQPVAAGTVVTLTRGGSIIQTTRTAADGSYAFPAVPREDGWSVSVSQPAGASGESTVTADTTAGDAIANLSFTAPVPDEVVSVPGEVVDADGAAVANVTVTASATAADAPDAGTSITAQTDTAGSFELTGLVSGQQYRVSVLGADPVLITTPVTTLLRIQLTAVTPPGGGSTPPPTEAPTSPASGKPGAGDTSSGIAPVRDSAPAATSELAYTGANLEPAITAAAVLLALGAALLIGSAARRRGQRRT